MSIWESKLKFHVFIVVLYSLTHLSKHVCMPVYTYVCIVCMYVCMYIVYTYMCVCTRVYVYFNRKI